ncbi:MAG: hypothetical protein GXO55_07745 [Chloroflexi bacterium]|nr:hypothetical protein [Chloroflexota bacterium]
MDGPRREAWWGKAHQLRPSACAPWRGERGQTLVLFALVLVVIIAMVALAVDGGHAYVQRRRMQYAADAAALAGARALVNHASPSRVDQVIRQYARDNGASSVTWRSRGPGDVEVRVSRTFSTFFAQIVGISSMTARAEAEARASGVASVRNALPIGVEAFPFRLNQVYELRHPPPLSSTAGPHFVWLDWNGGTRSSRELALYICEPERSGVQRIHRWVWDVPTVLPISYLRYCLNRRLGQVLIVPVYGATRGVGLARQYRIVGFAAFRMEAYHLGGPAEFVRGRFLQWVTDGDPGGPNYGLLTVQLVK